jgi:hypothetical protein
MDFKIPILSIFFSFLVFYIEVEVLCQFCFNPASMSNLITWSLVCMIVFTSKASTWFHWSNSRMWSVLMFTKDVKTSQGRLGTLWHKKVFFTICTRFDSCLVFPFEYVNFSNWNMWLTKIFFSWCSVNFWLQRTSL